MLSGRNKPLSVYHTFCNVNISTDSSYKKVGMLATTAQELRYMLFGSRSGTSFDHAVLSGCKQQPADLQQQFL